MRPHRQQINWHMELSFERKKAAVGLSRAQSPLTESKCQRWNCKSYNVTYKCSYHTRNGPHLKKNEKYDLLSSFLLHSPIISINIIIITIIIIIKGWGFSLLAWVRKKKHSAAIYYAWNLVNSVQCSYKYLSEKTQNK